ncbi:MAG: hypothetical protein ACNS63_12985 [Candidatus Nitrospinota bacterium M3_3B_026]
MTRLQGTDGVRRKTSLSSDPALAGMTPQRAFLEKDVITEEFMELYTYCRARQMIEAGLMEKGGTVVIGWDPRDPEGIFTDAAVRGLLKAGADAAVIGVAPTPAAPVYMRAIGAAGSVAVTASHNPPEYNGIKIFTRRGLKLLPGDDVELSRRVLQTDYETVVSARTEGKAIDRSAEAGEVFTRYVLDARNSWIESPETLKNIVLIADLANGALGPLAGDILRKAGFGEVVIVNDGLDGSVNERSGVAELEGLREITPDMIEKGGRLSGAKAMAALFEKGRENAERIKTGETIVSAAVFDGDGDRLFRVDYDPFTDSAFIGTGDETAVILAGRSSGGGKMFVNTVESDLSASAEAERLGYTTGLTAVGDKWILLKAVVSAVERAAPPEVLGKIGEIVRDKNPSADAIERLLDDEGVELVSALGAGFAIGAEESGHIVVPSVIDTKEGPRAVFAGDGLKSLLNSYAVLSGPLMGPLSPAERIGRLRHPFPGGYKRTIYIYYVDKSLWSEGSELWRKVSGVVEESVRAEWEGAGIEIMTLPEDRETLYMKITESGSHAASVFVRNSGTEDKTGVSLRGPMAARELLDRTGEAAARVLLAGMKDMTSPMARAEAALLEAVEAGEDFSQRLKSLSETERERLLLEAGFRQGLVEADGGAYTLTELGLWRLARLREAVL